MDLVAADYVEGDDDLYRLTTKGQNLLADRGVGVNESWPDQIGKAFPIRNAIQQRCRAFSFAGRTKSEPGNPLNAGRHFGSSACSSHSRICLAAIVRFGR
jgi:hypothetical protein